MSETNSGNEEGQEQKKLIYLSDAGVGCVDKEVFEKLAKKKLSPSLIKGMVDECPAKWLSQSLFINAVIPTPVDNALRRGSAFHSIMEAFFKLPPKERTYRALQETRKSVMSTDEYAELGRLREANEWLDDAINGYREMNFEDPTEVRIAKIKNKWGTEKDALEIFVSGKIGNTKRDILGFVDRVTVRKNSKGEDVYIVEDYKTGKAKPKYDSSKKNNKGFPEARQQIIYTRLLREQGVDVRGAKLIFPVARDIVNIDLDAASWEKVVASVEEADKKLTQMSDANLFEYNPSFLCSWCPMAKVCPKAQKSTFSKKARDAYESQPEPFELLPYIRDDR